MDLRLLAALTGPLEVSVSELCRRHGISRKTFHKWKKRFEAEGLDGLQPRSRRPHRSPQRISAEVEEAIVALRKEQLDDGLDAGPATIRWLLGKRRLAYPPPSEATIWRVLVRCGFVEPQPRKRPKSSLRRFEASFPNECWQIDATQWSLAGGRVVEIINVLDDHSRLVVASLAVANATCETAWAAFSRATHAYGVPVRCLSDNGLCFSGRLRGFEVDFEIKLRAAGIVAVTARPFHPQTCGKVERFQQTLKRFLRAQGPFDTLDDLQAAIDRFLAYYNDERPHRGIGRATPYQRWSSTPAAASPGIPLSGPSRRTTVTVGANGCADARPGHDGPQYRIHLGVEYAGQTGDLVLDDTHAAVYIGSRLIRHLTLDPTRSYQPSGRPRGGPKRQRRT